MKNKIIVILIATLIILTSISLAYKEEIKQTSEKIFQDYFQEKIQSLSGDQQRELNNLEETRGADKFIQAGKNYEKAQQITSSIIPGDSDE